MSIVVAIPSEMEFQALNASVKKLGWVPVQIGAGIKCSLEGLDACIIYHPSLILMLGICGAYPDSDLPIGSIVRVGSMALADLGARDQDGSRISASQIGMSNSVEFASAIDMAPKGLQSQLALLKEVHSLTVVSATGTLAEQQERIAQGNPHIEEMEGVLCAMTCRLKGIPFFHVRSVSNAVGPRDRFSWKIELALNSLQQWLDSMALNLESSK